MDSDSSLEQELLQRARDQDLRAVDHLFELHRARLAKMVKTRMNPRIVARVDHSDVLQESYLEAARRLPEYLDAPRAPFYLWLRQIVGHKIIDAHRVHLGAQARNVAAEISITRGRCPAATSENLADLILGRLTSPSQAAVREETRLALQRTINELDPIDREILALRQFEELSNSEAAAELDIEPAAASKRFIRALQRLQQKLSDLQLLESEA